MSSALIVSCYVQTYWSEVLHLLKNFLTAHMIFSSCKYWITDVHTLVFLSWIKCISIFWWHFYVHISGSEWSENTEGKLWLWFLVDQFYTGGFLLHQQKYFMTFSNILAFQASKDSMSLNTVLFQRFFLIFCLFVCLFVLLKVGWWYNNTLLFL